MVHCGLLLSECVANQSIMILHDVSLYSVYFPDNYVDYLHMLVFLQKREEATKHLSRLWQQNIFQNIFGMWGGHVLFYLFWGYSFDDR